MDQFKLHELVIGVMVGDVSEGDEFITSSGFKAVYKDGALTWVTQAGYVGAKVAITKESLAETFTKVNGQEIEKISFVDALPLIAEGVSVTIDMGHEQYTVNSLGELEDVIEFKEFLADLYKTPCYITLANPAVAKPVPFEMTADDLQYVEKELVPAILKELEAVTADKAGKKLSAGDAYAILHQYHFVKRSATSIADAYQVSPRMIYYIIDGTYWTEIHDTFHKEYCVVKEDYLK